MELSNLFCLHTRKPTGKHGSLALKKKVQIFQLPHPAKPWYSLCVCISLFSTWNLSLTPLSQLERHFIHNNLLREKVTGFCLKGNDWRSFTVCAAGCNSDLSVAPSTWLVCNIQLTERPSVHGLLVTWRCLHVQLCNNWF